VKTLSVDLRSRILEAYDKGEGTREEVAWRFRVSVGMVKKLLSQRRRIGRIEPQHHRSGRKPLILESHRRSMRTLLAKTPDMTLEELRSQLGLECTLPAIHYALAGMGLTYKKRLSMQANRSAQMSPRRAGGGADARVASTRRG